MMMMWLVQIIPEHYYSLWCCPLSSLHVSTLLTFILRDFITSPESKELNLDYFDQNLYFHG